MKNKRYWLVCKWWLLHGLYAALSGLAVMWLTFWYLSGSFSGLPRYLYTYYAASHFFMTPPSKDQLFTGSLEGMIASLGDAHSQYLDSKAYEDLLMQTSGTYTGIGIVLGKVDNQIGVVSALEGQPAAKAGIQSGDQIMAIDGKPTKDMALEKASSLIRGEAGTSVSLTIRHEGVDKTYTITREKITLPTVSGHMLTDHIGYIRISEFTEQTGSEFAKTYKDLRQKGMTKLILDLRNNPGGLVTAAQAVADYILPKGPIVTVENRVTGTEVYASQGLGDNLPLVVLINKGSASASEIIAGAVQDEKAGTIIGTNSYGKGTVQTVLKEFGGTGIKITIAQYRTPANRMIDGQGIKPDILVTLPNPPTEDSQLQKAIEVLQEK